MWGETYELMYIVPVIELFSPVKNFQILEYFYKFIVNHLVTARCPTL